MLVDNLEYDDIVMIVFILEKCYVIELGKIKLIG